MQTWITEERGVIKEHVVFNGKMFQRYLSSDHHTAREYFRSTDKVWLHRAVWEFYNGPIPDGHEIHHKDLNPQNNEIENLECLTIQEHKSFHATLRNPKSKSKTQSGTKKQRRGYGWHQTEEGKYWHSKNGKAIWEHKEAVEKTCVWCEDTFTTKQPTLARWCSRDCYFDQMRKTGGHNEKRVCKQCNIEFDTWKYGVIQCCSISCSRKYEKAMRHAGLNYDGTPRDKPFKYKIRRKICAFCGEIFERPHNSPENTYCGRECGVHAKMIDSNTWEWKPCDSCGNKFQSTISRPQKRCKNCRPAIIPN